MSAATSVTGPDLNAAARVVAGVAAWAVGGLLVVSATGDGLPGAAAAGTGAGLQAAFLAAEHVRYRKRDQGRWWLGRALVNAGLAVVAFVAATSAAVGVFAVYEARQATSTGGWAFLLILPLALALFLPPTLWWLARRTARAGTRAGTPLRRADTAALVLAGLMLPSVGLGCLKVLLGLAG